MRIEESDKQYSIWSRQSRTHLDGLYQESCMTHSAVSVSGAPVYTSSDLQRKCFQPSELDEWVLDFLCAIVVSSCF